MERLLKCPGQLVSTADLQRCHSRQDSAIGMLAQALGCAGSMRCQNPDWQ